MKNWVKATIPVAVVVILFLSFVAYGDDGRESITATVVEASSSTGFLLDISHEDIESLGADFGYDLYLEYEGKRYVAMYAKDFSGVTTGSLFINYDTEANEMTVALYNGLITKEMGVEPGDKFKISLDALNSYYEVIPHYIAGYTDDREDYPSDQAYGNYRFVTVGDIEDGTFYRTASPWLAPGGRNVLCDDFMREIGAEYLISLDRSDKEIAELCDKNPNLYASSLYEEGRVIGVKVSPAIFSYPDEIREILENYMKSDGTVGINCAYGKDRTGIYSTIFEALGGASYEEIRHDFMTSICNYYFIAEGGEEYEAVAHIYIDRVLYIFAHPEIIDHYLDVNWEGLDYEPYDPETEYMGFLTGYVGLSEEFVDAVKGKLRGGTQITGSADEALALA